MAFLLWLCLHELGSIAVWVKCVKYDNLLSGSAPGRTRLTTDILFYSVQLPNIFLMKGRGLPLKV